MVAIGGCRIDHVAEVTHRADGHDTERALAERDEPGHELLVEGLFVPVAQRGGGTAILFDRNRGAAPTDIMEPRNRTGADEAGIRGASLEESSADVPKCAEAEDVPHLVDHHFIEYV